MIKAIIFDLDNTLIDFVKMKKMSVSGAISAMQNAGLDLSKSKAEMIMYDLYNEHGMEYQKVIQAFLLKTMGRIDYKILANAIVGYRKVQRGFMKPYPKVKSTLKQLHNKGIKLAILTDAPRIRAWLRIAELGLSDAFQHVVCYEDTRTKKPSKKPFELILKKLRVEPGETMMVGDSLKKDVKGAQSVGMIACYAKYGESETGQDDLIKPDYIINTIEEILDIVKH